MKYYPHFLLSKARGEDYDVILYKCSVISLYDKYHPEDEIWKRKYALDMREEPFMDPWRFYHCLLNVPVSIFEEVLQRGLSSVMLYMYEYVRYRNPLWSEQLYIKSMMICIHRKHLDVLNLIILTNYELYQRYVYEHPIALYIALEDNDSLSLLRYVMKNVF